MDAWGVLSTNSMLGAGHDAWTHLNSQIGGSVNVVGPYEVSYVGELGRVIEYFDPIKASIEYVSGAQIIISYVDPLSRTIEYVFQEVINMEVSC